MRSKTLFSGLSLVFTVALAIILLTPDPVEAQPFWAGVANWVASLLDPTSTHRGNTFRCMEMWLNVLIFVPLSATFFLAFSKNRFAWSLGLSLLISAVSELFQFIALPNRVASVQDILLNFSGALFGVTCASLASRLRKYISFAKNR